MSVTRSAWLRRLCYAMVSAAGLVAVAGILRPHLPVTAYQIRSTEVTGQVLGAEAPYREPECGSRERPTAPPRTPLEGSNCRFLMTMLAGSLLRKMVTTSEVRPSAKHPCGFD